MHALKEEWAEWALALPEPSLRCLALVEMLEVFVKVRSHSAQRDYRFAKVRSHSAQRDTRFAKVRATGPYSAPPRQRIRCRALPTTH